MITIAHFLRFLSRIKLGELIIINSFAIDLKSIAIIFIMGLFTLSFLEDSSLLSISKKAPQEICDDMDTEQEDLKETKIIKSLINIFYPINENALSQNGISYLYKIAMLLEAHYAKDIEPPKA